MRRNLYFELNKRTKTALIKRFGLSPPFLCSQISIGLFTRRIKRSNPPPILGCPLLMKNCSSAFCCSSYLVTRRFEPRPPCWRQSASIANLFATDNVCRPYIVRDYEYMYKVEQGMTAAISLHRIELICRVKYSSVSTETDLSHQEQ